MLAGMSPVLATDIRPVSVDDERDLELFDEGDELLVEEISIDGMCGVY